jgi:hypothetical protein
MILEHFNPELIIKSDSYAWRYMDFNKLLDILENDCIYFSRLDTFHDPLEGLPFSLRSKIQTLHILECELTADQFAKHSIKWTALDNENVYKWKRGTFSSCWYLTEPVAGFSVSSSHSESLAMWNYLTEKESFVIKINFRQFLSLMQSAIENFIDEEIFAAKYGKTHYLNYGEYDRILGDEDKDFMPALIKHNAYRFENEVRFILLRDKLIDKSNDREGIKLKLKQHLYDNSIPIEVFSHPDIVGDRFKYYRQELKKFKIDLKASTILTRDYFNKSIN